MDTVLVSFFFSFLFLSCFLDFGRVLGNGGGRSFIGLFSTCCTWPSSEGVLVKCHKGHREREIKILNK